MFAKAITFVAILAAVVQGTFVSKRQDDSSGPTDHIVIVGFNDTLTFQPPQVIANVNDTVTFFFINKNHTVTQSTFDDPCNPIPNGMDSGFNQVVPAGSTEFPSVTVGITDASQPIWIHCAMYFKSIALIATFVASAVATNITIMVGLNGTTTFTPPQVNASVGDLIHFVFVAGNHSVVQSTFADPCTLKPEGFTNDFQTHPANHCHRGMVGAINPTPQMTFAAFQSKALALANTTSDDGTSGTSNTTTTSKSGTTSDTSGVSTLKVFSAGAGLLGIVASAMLTL
ncbi:hypothetical protein Clacol_006821 [Clathrus columnatus]|uniref:Cupredoxin n=1 Tax=Clathrus columnatus TaxID=1419009 RepID=A0AAV5AHH1_9AGAM|nr:hypothetical protein Clacol_006821 [Clathrus columnatus]